MKNNTTLLVDTNWLLQSRVAVMMSKFDSNNTKEFKEQASQELKELLAKSLSLLISKFQEIDNIILVADGGSWRKQMDAPTQLQGAAYKANRVYKNDIDWSFIYKAHKEFMDLANENGITISQYPDIEGDDWIWYWSKKLNSMKINCIIWSSDNDLKQLIQTDPNTNAFTVWYNDKQGMWLPNDLNNDNEDPLDFFMKFEYNSPVLESLKKHSPSINYIDPESIIIEKIVCGDTSDNISPILRYKKGTRNYRITPKDWLKIAKELNINTLDEFLTQKEYISNYLTTYPKYKEYGIPSNDIYEMMEYNTKLVWLDGGILHDTIIQNMNQIEYKQFDLKYIRSNYKVLTYDNKEIETIFEGIEL